MARFGSTARGAEGTGAGGRKVAGAGRSGALLRRLGRSLRVLLPSARGIDGAAARRAPRAHHARRPRAQDHARGLDAPRPRHLRYTVLALLETVHSRRRIARPVRGGGTRGPQHRAAVLRLDGARSRDRPRAGVLFLRRWSVVQSTAIAASAGAATVAASFGLFEAGYWLPVSAALGALAALYVGRGATAYLDEARRRSEIRRAFEHYVSPPIVAEMTAHPDKLVLGGQRRTLTVMFTDLAGFTSMSEGIAPEAVAQILNEHLTLMTGIVLAHSGTIDKFIGDAVMAFWGAPIDDPAHARHGVQAAIEMQAEMERFRREPGRPELHMRIGLNTGPVVVGNLGSKDRFAYTVIGDAVNLAARLEPLNRLYGTPILLSEETAAGVRDAITLRHVDRVRVKGRREAVEIYTPEIDAAIAEKTEAAIALYRAREWEGADREFRAVAELRPGDGVASVYLSRIERHRRHGVDAAWDGTFELDTNRLGRRDNRRVASALRRARQHGTADVRRDGNRRAPRARAVTASVPARPWKWRSSASRPRR